MSMERMETEVVAWRQTEVKVIGDARKYVALARLGKSFFFAKDKVQSQTPVRTTPILMHVSVCSYVCAAFAGSGEREGVSMTDGVATCKN
jgi:hypothetical protein